MAKSTNWSIWADSQLSLPARLLAESLARYLAIAADSTRVPFSVSRTGNLPVRDLALNSLDLATSSETTSSVISTPASLAVTKARSVKLLP